MPLARQVVLDLAVEHGACIRPVQLRRTNLDTGEVDQVLVPCGHTLAHVCPSCAERARSLRAAQCREGWHLEDEPVLTPDPATEDQRWWSWRSAPKPSSSATRPTPPGRTPADFDALITELDEEITKAGIRGKVNPDRPARRHRSTRRRQDAPDLPRRKVSARTVGKTYTAPDGKTFRPSMFVTLTCPSYGRVGEDGAPADPAAYDYDRAARDALAFAALFDRFIQNLRRYLGYDVQYFAAVEPQRRLAPHIHIAIRGTISRAELRRVLAATYHQVWWPARRGQVRRTASCRSGTRPPGTTSTRPPGKSCRPGTRPSTRSATRTSRGMWPGSGTGSTPRACCPAPRTPRRCIGYLTKYLTKQVGDCHQADTDAQRAHAARLAEALRYQPCSPRCANWLRYGIQPKNARPGLVPGRCKGKAHDADHLGYAGRRVLVSRKWSGKTLADHRADRKEWLLRHARCFGNRPGPVRLGTRRADRPGSHGPRPAAAARRRRPARWQTALAEARRRAAEPPATLPATGRAALWRISVTS